MYGGSPGDLQVMDLQVILQPGSMHARRTGKADELTQVAGHEVAQLCKGGDIDEADKEFPLQPILCQHQPLCVRPHKLLHRL